MRRWLYLHLTPAGRDEHRAAERYWSAVNAGAESDAIELPTIKWVDLFGIDPDYCDGKPVDEWLDENRGEA